MADHAVALVVRSRRLRVHAEEWIGLSSTRMTSVGVSSHRICGAWVGLRALART